MMPRWWYKEASTIGTLIQIGLRPASWLYRFMSFLRNKASMMHPAALPSLCIGNATVGGAGKTPTTLFLANLLNEMGHTPHIASRGYGSNAASNPSTVFVDVSQHSASEVGDEPLMMAQHFPVWVGQSRATSVAAAKENGATLALMDDGLQNPTIYKTASILVIDGGFGMGNGLIFPAGPLRETLQAALRRSCAVVIIGKDIQCCEQRIREFNADLPIFHAAANTQLPEEAAGKPLLAFAGLARPEKFFDGLRRAKANLIETRCFPDHHPFKEAELAALLDEANALGATLITTEKDKMRLPNSYLPMVMTAGLEMRMQESEKDQLKRLLATFFPPPAA